MASQTSFKDKALDAYKRSIADKSKAEDDARHRMFDTHMLQFLNKLRATHVLDYMPKGWKPNDYDVEVDGVRMVYEPAPVQSIVMPLMCSKCRKVMRNFPVTDIESVGRNLMEFTTAPNVCENCTGKVEKVDLTWEETIAKGLRMAIAAGMKAFEKGKIDNK